MDRDGTLAQINKRVTAPDAGTPVQIAPLGTVGTFYVQALGDNTGKIAIGGEPDISFPDDERLLAGPVAATATQSAPLFSKGYGLWIDGDLGRFWFDVQTADDGLCWLRTK